MPRLAGMVNIGKIKWAMMIVPPSAPFNRENFYLLSEQQRQEQIEVLEILPKIGTVRVNVYPEAHGVRLSLTNRAETFGQTIARSGLLLEQVSLEQVLGLYAKFSERTVLRSPKLKERSFNLQSAAESPAAAAKAISEALKDQGMVTILDGQKFVIVAPESQAASIKPRSAEIKPSTPSESEVLAPDTINFRGVDLNQVLAVYAELRDCKFDPTVSRPYIPAGVIHIRTQTALTRAELVYAFDTLLAWNGVKMVPSGEGKLKAVAYPEGTF